MEVNLAIKQFRYDGALSYILYDQQRLDAVVIDAQKGHMEDYRTALWENRLKVVLAADTGAVSQEMSASSFFRTEFKCDLLAPGAASVKVIPWGRHSLEVLETPGATGDSISLLFGGMVFTGDALWIGETARTDRAGADAGKMWRSAREVLGRLVDSTLVFPGHDYNGFLFSTIGIEKGKNSVFTYVNSELFFELKRAEAQAGAVDENRGVRNRPSSASISVEKFKKKLDEKTPGVICIDVRDELEFQEAHIFGSQNIPLEDLSRRLPELRAAKRIYLLCQSGRRSPMASATLDYVGLSDVVLVSGGIKAWVGAGYPLIGHKKISV